MIRAQVAPCEHTCVITLIGITLHHGRTNWRLQPGTILDHGMAVLAGLEGLVGLGSDSIKFPQV